MVVANRSDFLVARSNSFLPIKKVVVRDECRMCVGVGDQVDKEWSKWYELPLAILRRVEPEWDVGALITTVAGVVGSNVTYNLPTFGCRLWAEEIDIFHLHWRAFQPRSGIRLSPPTRWSYFGGAVQ